MEIEHYAQADVALAQAIVRLLDRLKGNGEDDDLHSLLSRGLQYFGCKGQIDEKCARWIHRQLDIYAADPLNSARTRIRARLLQQRITSFLPDIESAEVPEPVFSTPEPTTIADPESAPSPRQPEAPRNGKSHHVSDTARGRFERVKWKIHKSAPFDVTEFSEEEPEPESDPPADQATQAREALVQQLAETTEQLRKLERENQKLREDFARLNAKAKRRKSLPAPARAAGKGGRRVAAIPKRDTFLRQLIAEIERVRRHGAPLALALVDIDDLDAVDREQGRAAVNAVLNTYAGEIFANFRTYDIVARYHDDEFVLLFPNTAPDGALRALEKAQKRAAETHYALEGQSYPLPSFAGALTHYITGEEPDALLARAVDGIIEARGRSSERLVVM